MRFFQRLRYAFARFFYGRNGADTLAAVFCAAAVVLSIARMFVQINIVQSILSLISYFLLLYALFRCFSRNI